MAKKQPYTRDEEVILFIGNKVKSLRIKHGLTQEELANEAEIGVAQLKRIELGIVNTSISSIYRIAGALDISISDLVKGID